MNSYISMIPYANLGPVRCLGCPPGFSFIYLTPRQSADALAAGRAVAAPLPVGALLDLDRQVEPLGNYGIAASRKVGSVLLYSNKEIKSLDKSNTVYLTGQSATSVLMLFLLLEDLHGPHDQPTPINNAEKADAVLLIGDDAMVHADRGTYRYCYDLVDLWHKFFGRPMVFARWVVRRDAPPSVKRCLRAWLSKLEARDAALIRESAKIEAHRLGVTPDDMETYLKGMRRVLNTKDLAAQEFFLQKARLVYPRYLAWTNSHKNRKTASSDRPRAHGGGRINAKQCLAMLRTMPLGELMGMAHAERLRKHPGRLVSYVMDTNPNYTNICTAKCTFCAFHRDKGARDAYTLSPAALAAKVKKARNQGATTVLMQGGLNNDVSLARLVAYIRAIRAACPGMHIHPFSPPEIDAVARREGKSIDYILNTFWNEGIHTIPGGGAEILSDRVRRVVSPDKCTAARWLDIMEAAHRIGFRTTATMMYGHVERDDDIVEHLVRLRDLQDRTDGFKSFIAWSFKPGHSELSTKVAMPAHPALYVRITALARLFLDNFEHVQSSWFSESENAGSLALMGGADDFGGILVEENVLRTTGHIRRTTVENVKTMIRNSGFIPARRDSDYRLLEVDDT